MFESPLFEQVRCAVIEAARPRPSDQALDLGAGTGFLTLELAPLVAKVIAVDLSDAMVATLGNEASRRGIENVEARVVDLAVLDLPPDTVDLIVSNYALHHLTDADKSAVLERAHLWLRPGGRLVVADMMFGRGLTSQDRRIILNKVKRLLAKGPGGLLRVAKNLFRFGLRRGSELPAKPEFWVRAAEEAGFGSVRYQSIVAEAGLLTAVAAMPRPNDS